MLRINVNLESRFFNLFLLFGTAHSFFSFFVSVHTSGHPPSHF